VENRRGLKIKASSPSKGTERTKEKSKSVGAFLHAPALWAGDLKKGMLGGVANLGHLTFIFEKISDNYLTFVLFCDTIVALP
jgi:hypothetical protein